MRTSSFRVVGLIAAAFLSVWSAAQTGPRGGLVVEMPDPTSEAHAIEMVFEVPRLDAWEAANLQVLAAALADGSMDFGHQQMFAFASVLGAPQFVALPDGLRVSLSVSKNGLSAGLGVLEALLRRPVLGAETIDAARARLSVGPADTWSAAMAPNLADGSRVDRESVASLLRRLVQRGSMVLAVRGPFEPGTVRSLWSARVEAWPPERPDRAPLPGPEPRFRTVVPGPASVLEFVAPVVPARSVGLPAQVLAIGALGSGKGASLYRIVREEMRISYRQEALLFGAPGGFQPRMLIASTRRDLSNRVDEIRGALRRDIAEWTEADRVRAAAAVRSSLLYGIGMSPFDFGIGDSAAGRFRDETFVAGYWQLKTGTPWDPAEFARLVERVDLESMREAAADLIDAMGFRYYEGRG